MKPSDRIPSLTDLIRSDIREGRSGTPVALTLMVVNVNSGCSPVADAVVDIWQCDAEGHYSQYNQPGYNGTAQTFLRGIQATDARGQVTFTTIYPGWYAGRATHIHVEVSVNGRSVKVTQIAFPRDRQRRGVPQRRLRGTGPEPHVKRRGHGVRRQPVVGAGHRQRQSHRRICRHVHGGYRGLGAKPAQRPITRAQRRLPRRTQDHYGFLPLCLRVFVATWLRVLRG